MRCLRSSLSPYVERCVQWLNSNFKKHIYITTLRFTSRWRRWFQFQRTNMCRSKNVSSLTAGVSITLSTLTSIRIIHDATRIEPWVFRNFALPVAASWWTLYSRDVFDAMSACTDDGDHLQKNGWRIRRSSSGSLAGSLINLANLLEFVEVQTGFCRRRTKTRRRVVTGNLHWSMSFLTTILVNHHSIQSSFVAEQLQLSNITINTPQKNKHGGFVEKKKN